MTEQKKPRDLTGVTFKVPEHSCIWKVLRYHRNGDWICEESDHKTTRAFSSGEIMAGEGKFVPVMPYGNGHKVPFKEGDKKTVTVVPFSALPPEGVELLLENELTEDNAIACTDKSTGEVFIILASHKHSILPMEGTECVATYNGGTEWVLSDK